jgi:hypothetical protein
MEGRSCMKYQRATRHEDSTNFFQYLARILQVLKNHI